MTRTAVAVAAALAICGCRGHDRPVGAQPTPLSVKGASETDQSSAASDRENMRIQGPHSSAADSGELARNGKTCATDADCTGGMKCCYPCGIPGCKYACVMPLQGMCPLFP